MTQKHNLFETLKLYNEKGIYPLHMPGHKRQMSLPGVSTGYDYTEVDGTDDLHHPEGILRDAMERAAHVFGADRTWYLVNGSTCGNLAGVSAICPLNGELIVARNCHRSVFHALELRNILPHWVYPMYDEDYGILGSVDARDIERLLETYPGSRGVVITSPTYEGVVSDVASIAEVCHKYNVPLFVDEAHGAHFGLVESAGFPDSAIHRGADLVVQSAHKTLVGLTQSAFLHMKSAYVKEQDINRFIDIYETSSPSYPLMMSLDACTELVLKHGEEVFGRWSQMLFDFDERVKELKHLRVLNHGKSQAALGKYDSGYDNIFDHGLKGTLNKQFESKKTSPYYDFDKSKILINCRYTPFTGESLMELLRNRFHFETEMSLSQNVLAMTGPGDDPEQIIRLGEVLLEIDREIDDKTYSPDAVDIVPTIKHTPSDATDKLQHRQCLDSRDVLYGCNAGDDIASRGKSGVPYEKILSDKIIQTTTLQKAVETVGSCIELDAVAGYISGEYIYCYPPGIPLVVPGERLEKNVINKIKQLFHFGNKLHFTNSGDSTEDIYCITGSGTIDK